MTFIETILKGCFVIEPNIYKDNRGYFFESFNSKRFNIGIGKVVNFVQDNRSVSSKGVLRGLHYQIREHAQAKLVSVINGRVLDVAVDLRKGSSTYGNHITIELSAENKKQLFVPRGFAHGFIVLSEQAEFFYKCDNYYNQKAEAGILFNDKDLSIDWKTAQEDIVLSAKDSELPSFKNAKL